MYLLHISLHGLLRAKQLELGRDADTGGQIRYAVELANALGNSPLVDRIDLLTRQVYDSKIAPSYTQSTESINKKATIYRFPCGPKRYLRKEVLWPYLDCYVDQVLKHIRSVGRLPDVIHSHYADAGYIGCRLSALLGVPLVFTGHSLGRVKKQHLLLKGMKEEIVEQRFNISQRIEAEEESLSHAKVIIASTEQEVEEQYALYDHYPPENMYVIPPGVETHTFTPVQKNKHRPVVDEIKRFLTSVQKPIVLSVSRADERKNLLSLIESYATTPGLREKANLVLIMGNRDDISCMEKGPKEVLTQALLLIDRYDLYGSVAYIKKHESKDIPDLYRFAAEQKGVFINPALTEPFGLTLLEAAACGLPIVSTKDGGPKVISQKCQNAYLIDPLDKKEMGAALLNLLNNYDDWIKKSQNGITGVQKFYSWESHVNTYISLIKSCTIATVSTLSVNKKSKLPTADILLVCDIDNTLTGDAESIKELFKFIENSSKKICFAIATGRHLASAKKVLEEWEIPSPDIFITSVGTEIYYPNDPVPDRSWRKSINYRWERERVLKEVLKFPGLQLQSEENQREHKLSFLVNPKEIPKIKNIQQQLRRQNLYVNLIFSHDRYLDCLPIRASKGSAVGYLSVRWGLSMDQLVVAGDSGNDTDMLSGNSFGIVVSNYSTELEKLKGLPRIYFSKAPHAKGIIDGLQHYGFIESTMNLQEEYIHLC